MDPPQHTRQRGLVNRGFTPRMIGLLEQHITQICASLLDDVAAKGRADFVTDIAAPLPSQVIWSGHRGRTVGGFMSCPTV
jgi:cholest-4-en-3-one 26-monooxygenase